MTKKLADKLNPATAIRPVRVLDTGTGLILKSDIYTVSGRKTAYLKLLPKETIAKEALCWALARTLGLSVSQAHYVTVHSGDVEGLAENAQRTTGNTENLAFGLEHAGMSFGRIDNRRAVESRLENWPHALDCGVFDDWIVNGDRIPNNLLFAGENSFVLIDHDHALPSYASVDFQSTSDVLRSLSEGKTEFERRSLYRDAGPFLEGILNIDFEQILGMVLHENVPEISRNLFSEHIEFLRRRARVLPRIVANRLCGPQMRLKLDDEIGEEKERYL